VAPAHGANSLFMALSSSRCRCYPGLECNGASKTQANRPERNENHRSGLALPQELEPAQESGLAEEVK